MNKPITMAHVAKAAGVSVMTVSYVFNKPDRVAEATRQQVLKIADQLNYRGPNAAAIALRTGRPHQLGVILGEHLTYAFEDPQATAFLAGVAQECVDRGFGMSLIPVSGKDDDERLGGVDVAGYVVWTTAEDNPILDALESSGRPVVVNGGPARTDWGLVSLDDRQAAKDIAQVGLDGATHPAIVALPATYARTASIQTGADPGHVTFPVTRARLEGFAQATTDAGLDWAEVPVAFLSRNDQTEAFTAVTDLLTAHPQTDAIITMSDQIALGTLAAIRTTGRTVPGDITVTGWDDGPDARAANLTTVTQSLQDQGAACARLVLDATGSMLTDRIISDWQITERATTLPTVREPQ